MKHKKTTRDIRDMKAKKEKITALTAYDYYFAGIIDKSGIDLILVGDSLGMVFNGYDNTLPVKVDDIFYHASAVSRGVEEAIVVADMPFLSYQIDERSAIQNCGRFIKEGVSQAVKLEGGSPAICSLISKLVGIGIPVMGHIGLTPQLVQTIGGFRAQGKTKEAAKQILESAHRLEDSGVFSIVLESIPIDLAKKITGSVSVPTIGIGAGPYCDGQILVISDILGMFDGFKPKFARRYGEIGKQIRKSVADYIDDVRQNQFPNDDECYH